MISFLLERLLLTTETFSYIPNSNNREKLRNMSESFALKLCSVQKIDFIYRFWCELYYLEASIDILNIIS